MPALASINGLMLAVGVVFVASGRTDVCGVTELTVTVGRLLLPLPCFCCDDDADMVGAEVATEEEVSLETKEGAAEVEGEEEEAAEAAFLYFRARFRS